MNTHQIASSKWISEGLITWRLFVGGVVSFSLIYVPLALLGVNERTSAWIAFIGMVPILLVGQRRYTVSRSRSISIALKRAMDIVLAVLFVIALLPWFAVFSLAILLTSGRPIFSRQIRVGYQGHLFSLITFQTTSASGGEKHTRIGKIMRALSIDQLPQVLNVLRGEMSFVGPRPLPAEYLDLTRQESLLRHSVRPGLTGWAQVHLDPRKKKEDTWKQMIELDNWYVEHWSIAIDIMLVLETVSFILANGPKGALSPLPDPPKPIPAPRPKKRVSPQGIAHSA